MAESSCRVRKQTIVWVGVVTILCIATLALGVYFGLRRGAAIATNGEPCADIGKDILYKKGSAVEAAIAVLFCEGVACPQSMGLGGGFLMTIYKQDSGKVEILNAREMAPRLAKEDMFSTTACNISGAKAMAIPGELMGYWEAFQKYKSGNVQWKELVQPTIDLCNNGIRVSKNLAKLLEMYKDAIKNITSLSDIFINNKTNSVWKEGDILKRPKLAKTLVAIRDENATALYNGVLTDNLVSDIQRLGGVITKEDLMEYKVEWETPINTTLKDNITMYSVPPPGSGIILAFILNILNDFVYAENNITAYQRIAEAFKHGYGRKTQLGDPDFVDVRKLVDEFTSKEYAEKVRKRINDFWTSNDPKYYEAMGASNENHGTAHISVLAPNGDAVSVTSTINLYFGAKARSTSTGILLNNGMCDFSLFNMTPAMQNNHIKPGKHPLSSMVPSIFIDGNGDVRVITGSAGGQRITTTTALIAMQVLWFNKSLQEAVDAPRIYYDLFKDPGGMVLEYENEIPEEIIQGLKKIGHKMKNETPIGSTVTGIYKKGRNIEASVDQRRGGKAEVFYVFP